jgi:hypothetical protein
LNDRPVAPSGLSTAQNIHQFFSSLFSVSILFHCFAR